MRSALEPLEATRRGRWLGRPIVAYAASGGGHFSLLAALADQVPATRRAWLTVDGPRGRTLAAAGERVFTVPTFDARHLNLQNPIKCLMAALRLRPQVVVTSGAGVVLTFVVVCRLLGARIVFLETMARVSSPSRTGAILGRLADLHVVQWSELAARFPRAVLSRPVLLPKAATERSPGHGTFVSVGTHSEPFDRLLRAVDAAVRSGPLEAPCLAQAGPSTFCSAAVETVATLTPERFEEEIAGSSVVVGHCGAGLIASALRSGRRPIVMARRASLGEHVDDHQFQLARKLDRLGLIVHVEDSIDDSAVARANAPIVLQDPFAGLPDAENLLAVALKAFMV